MVTSRQQQAPSASPMKSPGLELIRKGRHTITPFQKRVYEAICDIPPGKVTTYKILAKKLDCKSAQAIGQALKRNPYAPAVPCHRVIASDLTIGGFSGQRSGDKIDKKQKLLEDEGVSFVESSISADSIYRFGDEKNID